MRLSDTAIQRPVLATVFALLLIAFGLIALERLPVQEYPAIDPPVVSIETNYPGASADVVETRITQVLEDRIAGIEGIDLIESTEVLSEHASHGTAVASILVGGQSIAHDLIGVAPDAEIITYDPGANDSVKDQVKW